MLWVFLGSALGEALDLISKNRLKFAFYLFFPKPQKVAAFNGDVDNREEAITKLLLPLRSRDAPN